MSKFIKGLSLCESFFIEIAQPIIEKYFTNLRYSAGLLGYGSDVLGYDDEISTDHMWGPRFYLFLNQDDMFLKEKLMEVLSTCFPYEYKGYSVNFSMTDPHDNGVRHPELISNGKVSPLVWIYSIDEFINEYIGMYPKTNIDWLALSEHRLLGFTSGKLFVDMLDIGKARANFKFYPSDVKLYLIASQWSMIAEEQAFVKRCSDCDDEIGSRIVCSRIVERLMRLCFLYENKYAPYSKWFGTAFKYLSVNDEIKSNLSLSMSANNIDDRETYLVQSQMLVAKLHNSSEITRKIDIEIQSYYGRDIKVLFVDKIATLVKEEIEDTVLKEYPLIGSLSQVGNFVELSDNPYYISGIKELYNDPKKR